MVSASGMDQPSLAYRERYRDAVPALVHGGHRVLPFRWDEPDLVKELGLPCIFVVKMPEYLGVGIPVGKVESDSGGGPVQLAGNVDLCSAFRIDEFHRGIILLVFRNIWLVFRVVLPVVPFHGRRQGEGAYSVNGLVVRAWTALYGFPWKHKGVRMRTIYTFEMAGFAADFGGNVVSVLYHHGNLL